VAQPVEPVQILPETQEIKGTRETISLKELEQQGYWLFYYDAKSGTYKRVPFTEKKYVIGDKGEWYYYLANHQENEKVTVIKADDGSIIGIEKGTGRVEAVVIKDIDKFYGVSVKVSDGSWDYNETAIRKRYVENIIIPAYVPKYNNHQDIQIPGTPYTLPLIRILVPRFYPVWEGEGRVRVVQELWPYWIFHNVEKNGKFIFPDLVGICRYGHCTGEPSSKVFDEIAKKEILADIGIDLFTNVSITNDKRYYSDFEDWIAVEDEMVKRGLVSVSDAEMLAKRALAAEEIGRMGQARGKDGTTYFAELHLKPGASISTKRNRGDGVWVDIKFDSFPLPLPKPYTIIGAFTQVDYE